MKNLKIAAKELNEVLGLDPRIKVVGVTEEALTEKVKEALELVDWDTDEFSPETTAFLKEMAGMSTDDEEVDDESDTADDDEAADEAADEVDDEVDLAAEIEAAEKKPVEKAMKLLREMIKTEDAFKSIRKKSITVFEVGQLANLMRKAIGAEVKEDAPEQKKTKKTKQTAETPAQKVPKNAKKGPGVIATIVGLIENSGKKGITKEEILKTLVTEFPERDSESMAKTINVQVPTRISKEKFLVESLEGGLYRKAGK